MYVSAPKTDIQQWHRPVIHGVDTGLRLGKCNDICLVSYNYMPVMKIFSLLVLLLKF